MKRRDLLRVARQLGILIIPAGVLLRRVSVAKMLRGNPTVPLSELRIIGRKSGKRGRR